VHLQAAKRKHRGSPLRRLKHADVDLHELPANALLIEVLDGGEPVEDDFGCAWMSGVKAGLTQKSVRAFEAGWLELL
jgi:hypothetical protein